MMEAKRPIFSNPVYSYDEVTKLYHVSLSVDGREDKSTGVGDTKYQAKRNACASYYHDNEIDNLAIPNDSALKPI